MNQVMDLESLPPPPHLVLILLNCALGGEVEGQVEASSSENLKDSGWWIQPSSRGGKCWYVEEIGYMIQN